VYLKHAFVKESGILRKQFGVNIQIGDCKAFSCKGTFFVSSYITITYLNCYCWICVYWIWY